MLEPDRRRRCGRLPQRPVLGRRRDAQRGQAADDAFPTPGVSSTAETVFSGVWTPVPAVSWPWVPACGSLEPPRRGGENAQKTRKNGEEMGEIRPKRCEGRELTKDHRRGDARHRRPRRRRVWSDLPLRDQGVGKDAGDGHDKDVALDTVAGQVRRLHGPGKIVILSRFACCPSR